MKFREIISGRYKVFARQKEDERLRNIQIIKYIESIASMAGIDIMDWDAKEMFGTGTGHKFIDDRNEINRRFFDKVEQIAKAASSVPSGDEILSVEVKTALKALEARHLASLIAQEEQKALRALSDARSQYREFELRLTRACEHSANARRLSGNSMDIETQIKTIMQGNFWNFIGVTSGHLISFVTRGDIVCQHKNPAAGVDISFNFGRLKAVYDASTFTLKVVGLERNTVINGHVHPHISSSGGVCWGSASEQASRQIMAGSIVEPMLLLSAVLMNYNSGNPYVAIEKFAEKLGTPEDQQAMYEMNSRRDEVQASLAEIDNMPLLVDDVDEAIPSMSVTDEARQAVEERDSVTQVQRAVGDPTGSVTITTTVPFLGA